MFRPCKQRPTMSSLLNIKSKPNDHECLHDNYKYSVPKMCVLGCGKFFRVCYLSHLDFVWYYLEYYKELRYLLESMKYSPTLWFIERKLGYIGVFSLIVS